MANYKEFEKAVLMASEAMGEIAKSLDEVILKAVKETRTFSESIASLGSVPSRFRIPLLSAREEGLAMIEFINGFLFVTAGTRFCTSMFRFEFVEGASGTSPLDSFLKILVSNKAVLTGDTVTCEVELHKEVVFAAPHPAFIIITAFRELGKKVGQFAMENKIPELFPRREIEWDERGRCFTQTGSFGIHPTFGIVLAKDEYGHVEIVADDMTKSAAEYTSVMGSSIAAGVERQGSAREALEYILEREQEEKEMPPVFDYVLVDPAGSNFKKGGFWNTHGIAYAMSTGTLRNGMLFENESHLLRVVVSADGKVTLQKKVKEEDDGTTEVSEA